MATTLEAPAVVVATRTIATAGWNPGKHAGAEPA